MRRLSVRLVASHLAVALLGGLATAVVVRQLAPSLFDERLRGMGRGTGVPASGAVRAEFAAAVDSALLIGTLVGVGVATAAGTFAAYQLLRSLARLRAATRQLAAGHYDTRLPLPAEQELAELSADVNRLGAALAETETRRVRLLGEVAHEMRTPLAVIDGYVEGMIDGVLGTGPEDLSLLSEEVRRLRRLTDDLSALSRTDEGRLDLQLAQLDLREVVAAVVDRLRAQAEDASVALQTGVSDQPVTVRADSDRIAQVVTNLVGNSLRVTPPGGRIEVSCRSADGRAEVCVADTGDGLAAEDLERVFERFYRVPGRRQGGDAGSGIGLTIARSIAAAHAGSLSAASAGPGTGATFTLRLPLQEA